jgi:hypothetical protein
MLLGEPTISFANRVCVGCGPHTKNFIVGRRGSDQRVISGSIMAEKLGKKKASSDA